MCADRWSELPDCDVCKENPVSKLQVLLLQYLSGLEPHAHGGGIYS